MADAQILVAFKRLEAVGVPAGMKGPSADPVGTQVGTGCFLHLLSAEMGGRAQRGDKEQAVPPPRRHCSRRCSELWDIFLGHHAGAQFCFVFFKAFFQNAQYFINVNYFRTSSRILRLGVGGLIPSTLTLPATGLTP